MEMQLERRVGNDRRQSLLLGLDRRKPSEDSRDHQLNGKVNNPEPLGDEMSDRAWLVPENYWGTGENGPPV